MDSLFRAHLETYSRMKSGMHVALLGTTRGGKTTLALGKGNGLLRHWENCLVIDSTGDPGEIKDYGKPLSKRGKIKGHERLTVSDSSERSREKIYRALDRAVRQGNMVIYADEIRQLADRDFFNLQKILEHIWLFTAKRGVSLVGGTQAPRWVPSPLYDQSKSHFIFSMRDRRAMKRLAEISGDVDTLETLIPNLKRFEFAYVGIEGDVVRSKFEMQPARQTTQEKRMLETDPSRYRILDSRRRKSYDAVRIQRSGGKASELTRLT